MNNEEFTKLLKELDDASKSTMSGRNANYAQGEDRLHNFRSGADIMGGTPAQACWGYLTKHLVALRDKVERNDFSDREDFLEKCQDAINYFRFLWCIGNEENNKNNKIDMEDTKEQTKCPYRCNSDKRFCCYSGEYASPCIGYDKCAIYNSYIKRKNIKEM